MCKSDVLFLSFVFSKLFLYCMSYSRYLWTLLCVHVSNCIQPCSSLLSFRSLSSAELQRFPSVCSRATRRCWRTENYPDIDPVAALEDSWQIPLLSFTWPTNHITTSRSAGATSCCAGPGGCTLHQDTDNDLCPILTPPLMVFPPETADISGSPSLANAAPLCI